MAAVFVFISPARFREREWLVWRRTARRPTWPPDSTGRRYGEALTTSAADAPSGGGLLDEVEASIVASRFNAGVMFRLPQHARRVQAAFDEPWTANRVSTAAWALASRGDGLVIVTAVAVDLPATDLARRLGQDEARRRFDAAVFDQDGECRPDEAAALNRAGLPNAVGGIRREATQLLCLVRHDGRPPAGLLRVHESEEGDAANCGSELDLDRVLDGYLHVGFSNTTVVSAAWPAMVALVPLVIKAQSVWFVQRELRTRILAVDFEQRQRSRRETRDLLLHFQELRFELHLWDSENEAYRAALVPWQARVFGRYMTSWRVPETYTRLTRLVDHGYDLLHATTDRFDGILEARQANILATIAIVQLVGVGGAVAGYFDLANLSRLDLGPIARAPAFQLLVGTLPAITAVAILALVLAARRRH